MARRRRNIGIAQHQRAADNGACDAPALDHDRLFAPLRRARAAPPVLGFGISTPERVRQALASGAAGVIAGSAIVRRIGEQNEPAAAIHHFVSAMKGATGLPQAA